jgi:regulator of sigma E protease
LRDAQGEKIFRMLDMASLTARDLDGDIVLKLGLKPNLSPILGKPLANSVAERAGLMEFDSVLRVNGQEVAKWKDFVTAINSHPAEKLDIDIERSGSILKLSLTPEVFDEGGKSIGRIGVPPFIATEVHYPALIALQEALRKTWDTAVFSLKMLGKMVVGEISLKNLSGPITIADYAGQSAQIGLGAYIGFLALISISLGVLNLLPIPLLDGGHLLYYSVELIKGSPVSESLWEAGQKVGIALLVTMMAFALYNDISRLILG